MTILPMLIQRIC